MHNEDVPRTSKIRTSDHFHHVLGDTRCGPALVSFVCVHCLEDKVLERGRGRVQDWVAEQVVLVSSWCNHVSAITKPKLMHRQGWGILLFRQQNLHYILGENNTGILTWTVDPPRTFRISDHEEFLH